MSEKTRKPPSLFQAVLSVQINPQASFSSLSSWAISLSRAGSLRMILPHVESAFFSPAAAGEATRHGIVNARSNRRIMVNSSCERAREFPAVINHRRGNATQIRLELQINTDTTLFGLCRGWLLGLRLRRH